MTPMRYIGNCVSPPFKVNDLIDLVDNSREITRETFLKKVNKVDLAELQRHLGYAEYPAHGMTMASDYAVSYHKGKLNGKWIYYFTHSAIEYFFK